MVYVDENGMQIESPDLTLGYLVDHEWVDHPAQEQTGHYDYVESEDGHLLQMFVVDSPASSAWREVTVQKYIRYTEDELEAIAKSDYAARIRVLEEANATQVSTNTLLTAQVQALSDRGDFVEDCLAEMAQVVYA